MTESRNGKFYFNDQERARIVKLAKEYRTQGMTLVKIVQKLYDDHGVKYPNGKILSFATLNGWMRIKRRTRRRFPKPESIDRVAHTSESKALLELVCEMKISKSKKLSILSALLD